MATKLHRPVGLDELALIWDSGCREFPPRLPHAPIFYPVTWEEYAMRIARDCNTKAPNFAGFVTSFQVDDEYRLQFVGSAIHEVYWLRADELAEFHRAIQGQIEVDDGFFGGSFIGLVPDQCGLKGEEPRRTIHRLGPELGLQPYGFQSRDIAKSESRLPQLPALG